MHKVYIKTKNGRSPQKKRVDIKNAGTKCGGGMQHKKLAVCIIRMIDRMCVCVPWMCVCVPWMCVCVPWMCVCVPWMCVCVPWMFVCVPWMCVCVRGCLYVCRGCVYVCVDVCMCAAIHFRFHSTAARTGSRWKSEHQLKKNLSHFDLKSRVN